MVLLRTFLTVLALTSMVLSAVLSERDIAEATAAGDFHRIVLGIATMSIFVVAINRVFWRPLYYFAERKFRLA